MTDHVTNNHFKIVAIFHRSRPFRTVTHKYGSAPKICCTCWRNRYQKKHLALYNRDTESWLTSNHTNAEVFPSNYKVFRRDRKTSKGVGFSSLSTRNITALRQKNYTLITTVRCYGSSCPWLEWVAFTLELFTVHQIWTSLNTSYRI